LNGWIRYYRVPWNNPVLHRPGLFAVCNNLPLLRATGTNAGEVAGAVRVYDKGQDRLNTRHGLVGGELAVAGHGTPQFPLDTSVPATVYPQCPALPDDDEDCCLCDEDEGLDGDCDDGDEC